MLEWIYYHLEQIDTLFWGYVGFSLIMVLGVYFSIKTRFFSNQGYPTYF